MFKWLFICLVSGIEHWSQNVARDCDVILSGAAVIGPKGQVGVFQRPKDGNLVAQLSGFCPFILCDVLDYDILEFLKCPKLLCLISNRANRYPGLELSIFRADVLMETGVVLC